MSSICLIVSKELPITAIRRFNLSHTSRGAALSHIHTHTEREREREREREGERHDRSSGQTETHMTKRPTKENSTKTTFAAAVLEEPP
jgi:hypothetical protein